MKTLKLLLYSLLISSLLITSCNKDDDETPINEAQVLVEYLESPNSPLGKDYANTELGSYILATDVHTDIVAGTEFYLIDVRKAEDFALGHIDGAVNKPAGDVLDYIQTEGFAMDDKIVIACYSGQEAGWLTCILRLNGYKNAFTLKWGMCQWNSFFAGSWQGNVSNMYATQFEDGNVAKAAKGNLPTLSTGQTTGQAIFESRVATVLAEGFGGSAITNTEVFANLGNYYIVNYFTEADYTKYGHVPSAMQYTPNESFAYDVDLTTLPTDKKVVAYCHSGQTSAFLAAYLRILGYDAKSLKYGTNGMIYDEMDSSKWSDAGIMEYDYVTGK